MLCSHIPNTCNGFAFLNMSVVVANLTSTYLGSLNSAYLLCYILPCVTTNMCHHLPFALAWLLVYTRIPSRSRPTCFVSPHPCGSEEAALSAQPIMVRVFIMHACFHEWFLDRHLSITHVVRFTMTSAYIVGPHPCGSSSVAHKCPKAHLACGASCRLSGFDTTGHRFKPQW